MKGFFAIASLEIARRRSVLVAAAIAAAGAFLAPLLKAPRSHSAADIRLMAAAFLAVTVAAALSLMLGATAIGSELSGRRLGFYFSRPIGGGAIWAGKLAASWVLVLLVSAIVLLPAVLSDVTAWKQMTGPWFGTAAAAFAGSILVLLAFGSLAGIAILSRSAWVAAELLALAVWAGLISVIAFPLFAAGAPLLLRGLALAAAAAGAAAVLAAGAAQVGFGRTDSARGNRARAVTLWSLLLVIVALWLVSVRRVLSVSPGDLLSPAVAAVAPSGSWIAIDGVARGRVDLRASLLYDVDSKRFVPVGTGGRSPVVFSADGSAAAWIAPTTVWPDGPQEIWMCRLSAPAPARVRTPVSGRIWNLEISPDGSRIAVIGDAAIAIHEIPSGRFLAAVPTAGARFSRVVFLGPSRLRLYRIPSPGVSSLAEEPAAIEIFEFDVAARRMSPAATIANIRRPFALTFDERRGELIVWERGNSFSLFDAASGRLIAVLANASWEAASRAFLSDGRIAIGEASGGTGRVHLFSRNGEPERIFETGPAAVLWIGGEPVKGALAIAAGPEPPPGAARDSSLLDLETGSLRPIGRHLVPVASRLRWRYPQPDAGSVPSLLFSRGDGVLLRLDPATGRLEPVFPGRRR